MIQRYHTLWWVSSVVDVMIQHYHTLGCVVHLVVMIQYTSTLSYTRVAGTHIVVNGKRCLNLGTFNFLGFAGNQSVKVSNICVMCIFVCVCIV